MCNKQKVSRILVTYMSALGYIFYAAASWQPKALYWRGNGLHLLKLISKKSKKGTSELTINPPPASIKIKKIVIDTHIAETSEDECTLPLNKSNFLDQIQTSNELSS